MEPEFNFTPFKRKSFTVEAVQITEQNIYSVGALIGMTKVHTGSDPKVQCQVGEKYIHIDRRIVPIVRRAYVGWWLTRMGDNLRCFAPQVFEDQFEEAHKSNVFDSVITTPTV